MKLRLLKGTLFLAIAILVVGLYLQVKRKDSSTGLPAAAHRATVESSYGGQHEREMLKMVLEKNPSHIPVLLRLAEIESEEGHLQDSAGHLQKILQTEPDNPDANLELGKVLFQLGDIRGAIEHTGRILRARPAYEEALYNMGAIYANIGDKADAMAYWKRLVASNAHSENAKKAQVMMSRLQTNNP